MVGKSTGGNAEIGRSEYPSNPSKTTPTMSNAVATGLLMNGSEMLMPDASFFRGPSVAVRPAFGHCRRVRAAASPVAFAAAGLVAGRDLGTILQTILSIHHDGVSFTQTAAALGIL